jgi:hypothetical protein
MGKCVGKDLCKICADMRSVGSNRRLRRNWCAPTTAN